MTLFSIALRNIKRNFYDFFLYFLSMIFSILIFFTFVSIKYNEQVLKLGEVRQRIAAGFTASSVVLAVFAFIFIWYSNSFFTRKRKKEIGLYSLLGIKKKEIGRMLFYENIIMGIVALVIGIFLGSLLSKVFVMLLVRLMEFSAPITLTIIPEAIYGTIKVFAILFLLTSIHGYLIIYRFKLVDLFRAEKEAEREPKASVVKAILAIIFIVGGYVFYVTTRNINFLYLILITLISVVTGTFLLFSSLSVFIIKLARRNKKKYYKGINMIGISNLLYRIKGHARTLAIIAVLSATTLTAMSVTASLYYYFKTSLDYMAPFSFAFITDNQRVFSNLDREINRAVEKYSSHQIKKAVSYRVFQVKGDIPMGLGGSYSTLDMYLLNESTYNKIAALRGIERLKLEKADECFLVDEYYNEFFKEGYQGKLIKIHQKKEPLNLKVINFSEKPLLNLGLLRRAVVINDELYDSIVGEGSIIIGKAYEVSNENNSQELIAELAGIFKNSTSKDKAWSIRYSSYYDYYHVGITTYGQSIFIGAFLGLVFLISTGSIIFFKLLSEASEEGMRYRILRNIGVSKREIKSLLSKQILFFFASPLFIGIVHSLVAVSILEKILGMDLTVPITVTIIAYTIIYMLYYIMTVSSYAKNINLK